VVGVLTGLGILCKLTMLLFAPGVLVFLLWSPTYRRWLATPHPYAAFAIALLLFAPIIGWNATHGWMGFLHTYTLGSRSRNAAPFHWFGDFLGGQCVAVGPFLFLAELIVVGSLCTPRLPRWWTDSDDARRFLIAFVAPTLAICLVDSLKSKLEINWPAPAHLAGLALIGIYFDYLWQRGRAGGRILVLFATGFSLIGTLVAFFPQFLTLVVHPVPSQTAQKLNQTYGWEQIAIRIQAERESLAAEGKPVFVSGINYRTNSVMAFYLPDHPQTQALYLNSRRDQYVVWTHPETLIGQNAILCLDDKNPDAIAVADSIFDSVTLVETVDIQRPGFDGSVKRWDIYACRGFKGYDVDRYTQGY
jgi:undecaprenyl-diphosphatase